ncbi:MAG: methylated-DNA--[protein]-cysteine S-methyltransferase [Chlorobium sp.]
MNTEIAEIMKNLKLSVHNTLIGRVGIAEDDGSITNLFFANDKLPLGIERVETKGVREAFRQLDSYLAGSLKAFSLPLAPAGTPFMLAVWRILSKIPYGTTVSYRDVAVALGNPFAARAVGMANHRNPLPLFIPCHRVIGSDGTLAGYRGGLALKKLLLELERG